MRNFRNRTFAILTILLIGAQGCIAIPHPYQAVDSTRIENEEMEFIQIGQTRREDIVRQLGRPDYNYGDGTRWLFVVTSTLEGGVRWCGEISCTNRKDAQSNTYLDLLFDNSGFVISRQLISAKNGEVANTENFFDPGTSTFNYAAIGKDQIAKQFVASPDQCAVYLFMSNIPGAIYVQVDEILPRTRFRSVTTFVRLDLDSGVRKMSFFDKNRYSWRELREQPTSLGKLTDPIEVDCTNGDLSFLQGQFQADQNLAITFVSETAGRQEIMKRTLIQSQIDVSW